MADETTIPAPATAPYDGLSFLQISLGLRNWRTHENSQHTGTPTAAVALFCRVKEGKPVVSGYISELSTEQAVALASAIVRELGRRHGRSETVTCDPAVPVSDEGVPRPDLTGKPVA